jgi:hypothetical protein
MLSPPFSPANTFAQDACRARVNRISRPAPVEMDRTETICLPFYRWATPSFGSSTERYERALWRRFCSKVK